MAEDETRAEPTQKYLHAKMIDEEEKNIHRGGLSPSEGYAVRDRSRLPLFCISVIIFLVLAGISALTIFLIYRPHKPKFRVVSAAVYELNATSPPFMHTTMQFTIVIKNPNHRLSISYDHMSAFVSYKNQAITPSTMLPPLIQETKSSVTLSPVLGGTEVPVGLEVVNGLMMDEAIGVVCLSLVLTGKLRYKAGAVIKSIGHYGIYVRCDFFVGLKNGFVGQLPLLGSNLNCRVYI